MLYVMDPEYITVDVTVTVAKREESNPNTLEKKVENAITEFFNPEHGGEAQKTVDYIEGITQERGPGWEFGRDVYISELYELLERIQGLDHVEAIIAPSSNISINKNQLPLAGTVFVTVV